MPILEKARELVRENQYPPEYDPDGWKQENLVDNCYPYALNLKLEDSFLIGDFIGKRVTDHSSDDELLDVFYEELDSLGYLVDEVESDTPCKEGSLKIFLGRDASGDYHLMREDSDGLWSHKASQFLPCRRDSSGYPIISPEDSCTTYVVGWCFQLTKKEQ